MCNCGWVPPPPPRASVGGQGDRRHWPGRWIHQPEPESGPKSDSINLLKMLDPFQFERPIGVDVDRTELRYVSALHQTTMPMPRQDGCVLPEDVKLMLMSKHGLKVTDTEAEDIASMAGVPGEKWLDLPKLMAMLWIPWLLREARKPTVDEVKGKELGSPLKILVDRMLQLMCGSDGTLSRAQFLAHLRSIGESQLAENEELVDEMLEMIDHGESLPLKPDAIVQGLTSDVQQWSTLAEDSCTTPFFDVFGIDKTCIYGSDLPNQVELTAHQPPSNRVDEGDTEDVEMNGYRVSTSASVGSTTTPSDDPQVTPRRPVCVQTSSQIDFMNDSFRSLGLVALVFVFYLVNVVVYTAALLVVVNDAQPSCDDFSCVFTITIVNWFVIVGVVCITGLVLLGAAMLTNNPRAMSKRKCIFAVFSSSSLAVVPFVIMQEYRNDEEVRSSLSFVSSDIYFGLMVTCLCLGGLVVLVQLFTIAELIWPSVRAKLGLREPYFQRASHWTKHAGVAKVSKMADNLTNFHSSLQTGTSEFAIMANVLVKPLLIEDEQGNPRGMGLSQEEYNSVNPSSSACDPPKVQSQSGSLLQTNSSIHANSCEDNCETDDQAVSRNMHSDVQTGSRCTSGQVNTSSNAYKGNTLSSKSECTGGFIWSWKRVCSLQHWQEEGLWFSANILLGQISQIFMLILFAVALSLATVGAANACTSKREEVSGQPFALRFIPQAWMINYSFIPALIVAILIGIYEVVCYIPSFQSTILKMRCGLIPCLDGKRFHLNRKSADMIYSVVADMMYMMLGSMALLWFIFAACLFLLFWPLTQTLMLYLIAWGLGLTITVAARMIVQWACRRSFSKGMYRVRVKPDNIKNLALECWRMGTGSGGLLVRLGLLLLAVAVFIGRIDVDLLQEDLAIFDGYPRWFQVDLIVHEAHRHPYIERLATLYLYRWAYYRRNQFGKTSGACWRLVFVLTLMPWLVRDRVRVIQDPAAAPLEASVAGKQKWTGWLRQRKQVCGNRCKEENEGL